jgi:hypothetical protein
LQILTLKRIGIFNGATTGLAERPGQPHAPAALSSA